MIITARELAQIVFKDDRPKAPKHLVMVRIYSEGANFNNNAGEAGEIGFDGARSFCISSPDALVWSRDCTSAGVCQTGKTLIRCFYNKNKNEFIIKLSTNLKSQQTCRAYGDQE